MTGAFDVCGPLPTGVTVLEASAGTGKTWTIAALAARYVAEGTPLERLLLVTFTRMATGELRERVRERLVGAERALAGNAPQDELVRHLAAGTPDEVAQRRANLARAVADFDAATIATTHGFCQEVLSGLGVAGDVERDTEFVEDVTDLVDEVVDDLYVRRFHSTGEASFTREEAGRIASIAVANPLAPIEPAGVEEHTVPAMRARLADAVRRELDRRKQRAGVITYDDLLTHLDRTLARPGGAEVARRLQERFTVVLVDEFQDTDPVQWNIMRRAFGGGTLVLIGDPKQAIYAFRGADVYAYLDAAQQATTRATLEVNRRSDQGLIDAYDALFGGAKLGHEGIEYRQVRATEANQRSRLSGAPENAPLRIRVAHRDEPHIGTTPRGFALTTPAREYVAKDVAADLVRLLNSEALVDGAPIEPSDVAVLVQTNRAAALVRDALGDVGVPAVINGAGSVFATAQAREWLRLLEAIERPTSPPRAHAAALTPFLGWSAARIAGATDEDWEAVHRRLHDWARVLRAGGVASLIETVTLAEGLPERVLAAVDGERRLTDLRHIGQLLHAAATTEQLGTTALVAWLRRRITEADQDTSDEDRSRRLESDAQAVQVLTVHRSKGLEFPIVYYPQLWEPGYIPTGLPVAYHDPAAGDRRTIDVGLQGPDFERHKQQHLIEERGEDLRLAYVALTRAKHQAVVWWAGSFSCRDSALGRLLFERAADGSVPATGRKTPSDSEAVARFEELAAAAPGCISVERARLGRPEAWRGTLRPPAALTAGRFDRDLDRRWRRTSFSDITSAAHDARVASEPEEAVLEDEPEGPVRVPAPGGDDALRETASLLGEMPAGTSVGTFVHRVLEATDFAAAGPRRRAGCPGGRRAGAAGGRHRRLDHHRRGPEGGDRDAARRIPAARPRARRSPRRARLRVPAGGRRRADRPPGARGDRRGAARAPAGRGPAGRVRGSARRPGAAQRRARLRHRQHRPRGAHRRPLHGRRLQDELARRARRAAQRLAPPARRAGRRDGARPLRAAGAAVHGRAAPLPALAAGRLRPGAPPRRRALPVRARDDRAGHAGGRRRALRRVRLAAARRARRGAQRRTGPGGMSDARIAVRATGLLREFNDAGVLAPADVHVASRLAALAGESDEAVVLAAALAVRGPRLGHVYVDLATIRDTATVDTDEPVDVAALPWPDGWPENVAASPLVGEGRPLRLQGTALYLDRYWREERQVARDLRALAAMPQAGIDDAALRDGLARFDDPRQRLAAETAVRRRFAVVAGGPGTGKTRTVAGIVALLLEHDPSTLIGLAAPTAVAAARLTDAMRQVGVEDLEASTLHRLLGWRPGAHSRFRHDRGNRLPHDVVIVDETSMVSLSLMARLVEAVRADARLILVGDPGQLTSIEAGAVLGDIAAAGGDAIVTLDEVYRYDEDIARVAEAIRRGDADATVAALRGVTWIEDDDIEPVRARATATARAVTAAARAGDGPAAIEALGSFRLLCAHRRGPYGVGEWTNRIEAWIGNDGAAEWYAGRPLLMTRNDYGLQLYNGDTGVVVEREPGVLMAAFERVEVSPTRLDAVETVYAMTVHKAQGSQFGTAAVVLPEPDSPILTRELLYTAVTRARRELIVVGGEASIRAAVARPVARASGLRALLTG